MVFTNYAWVCIWNKLNKTRKKHLPKYLGILFLILKNFGGTFFKSEYFWSGLALLKFALEICEFQLFGGSLKVLYPIGVVDFVFTCGLLFEIDMWGCCGQLLMFKGLVSVFEVVAVLVLVEQGWTLMSVFKLLVMLKENKLYVI